jgi:peptide methionine sulfoxide reductase MsrA
MKSRVRIFSNSPLGAFYKAENYHQNYAELNPNQPYIAAVSTPKVEKLKQKYGEYLRK